MSETYSSRSPRSTLDWLAKLTSLLNELEMRPILEEDWGVLVSAWPPVADDFESVPFEDRDELLKVLNLALGEADSSITVGRSRINGVILAWENPAFAAPTEPPTATGEIPVID